MLPVGYVGIPVGGGGGGGDAPGDYLDIEDATLIGSDIWAQTGDTIAATVPIPAGAVSTLGGATGCPSFLVWPLGPLAGTAGNLTVADVMTVMMEMEFVSIPSDNNVRFLLPFGVIASTSATPGGINFAADKSRWNSPYCGSGASTPGTTVGAWASQNNNNPAQVPTNRTLAVSGSFTCSFTPRSTVFEADSFSTVTADAGISRSNNNNNDDYTATWNLYAFLAAGRGITSGATVAPQVKLRAGVLRRA